MTKTFVTAFTFSDMTALAAAEAEIKAFVAAQYPDAPTAEPVISVEVEKRGPNVDGSYNIALFKYADNSGNTTFATVIS